MIERDEVGTGNASAVAPPHARAHEALAELLTTLAAARQARQEAERRIAEPPAERLEDILQDSPFGHVAFLGIAVRARN